MYEKTINKEKNPDNSNGPHKYKNWIKNHLLVGFLLKCINYM